MKIKIKTLVESSMQVVWEGFDEELFKKLSPPFPKVEVLRFDGCNKGDEVHLKLLIPFLPQFWFAKIVEYSLSGSEIYFIDQGIKLPFFLTKWKHKHWIIKSSESKSFIVDDIDFSTGTILTDVLFYPILFAQFLYRTPIYKRYFRNRNLK